jgi:fluoride exporter
MKPIVIVLIASGAVLGAFLRYKMTESPLLLGILPLNVLIVNVVGSFILGLFAVITLHWNLDQNYTLFVAVGFCGSLTTMSSFAFETSNLLEAKQLGLVAFNIVANVGLSIGAIIGGRALMGTILNVIPK